MGTKKQRLLTEAEAANLLQVSVRWFRERRYRGEGPPFLRFGRLHLIRYSTDDLWAWAQQFTEGNGDEKTETGEEMKGPAAGKAFE